MRASVLLIAIFIQVPAFFFIIPAQAQGGEPEIELDCGNAPSYPFDYTYGIGMEYHTPIECEIENPSSYVVEVDISWTWEWEVEITDEDGNVIDATQQIGANSNLTFLLEISSPNMQKIGDYEIEVAAIVTRYGIGQDAMTDCSSCEEESVTETVVIHPYYLYSPNLVDIHQWRDGDWSYTVDDQEQFPDCPQGIFWSEYEFTIQANHDGYFSFGNWMGDEHQSWLISSDGSKTSLFSEIKYETNKAISFKVRFEWNMTSIMKSQTDYELSHYPVRFWWTGEAEMDNSQYSIIKTYHPNHHFAEDITYWQDRDTDGSLRQMDTMPCWAVGEIAHAEDTNVNVDKIVVPALSFPSTIMIILLCAILRRRNG